MHDFLAFQESDEYHGDGTPVKLKLDHFDLERLTVCQFNSTKCFHGSDVFRAMAEPAEMDLEQIDLEQNTQTEIPVVRMNNGLYRVAPEHQSRLSTGLHLPREVAQINSTKWQIDSKKTLGEGSYKKVYLGHMGTQPVAICEIPPPNHNTLFPQNELNYLTFELKYQMLIHQTTIGGKHICADYVPNVYGVHEVKEGNKIKTVYLIRELLDGSLEDEKITDPVAGVDTAIQMAVVLKCMKNAHVLHRDIKPSNYLYRKAADGTRQVFLQDFGLACNACDDLANPCGDDDVENLRDQCGSGKFMAPEMLVENSLYRFDMYSQAVTYEELGIGAHVPAMHKLIEKMKESDYHLRPTPDDLLEQLFKIRLSMASPNQLEETDEASIEKKQQLHRILSKMKSLATMLADQHKSVRFSQQHPQCSKVPSPEQARQYLSKINKGLREV
eukprot:c9738_g1_i1.p1 GENE.c9738_g1_i1~~c9738_g1_i1.p1  ORF type:complete len:508 (-),score=141.66 c9738_g1_i1:47-1372(-)